MAKYRVRGFGDNNGNTEYARELYKRERIGDPNVLVSENVSLRANMTFDTARLEYHDTGKKSRRPYLFFEGRITSVINPPEEENLPHNVVQVLFTETNAPIVNVEWELHNEEIADLVNKGLFGFDYDVNALWNSRPKTDFRIPDVFTQSEFTDVPIRATIRSEVMERKDDQKQVPIVAISVHDPYHIQTDSKVTGYGSLGSYFDDPQFYPQGYKEKEEMFLNLDEAAIIKEELSEEQLAELSESKSNKVLAPVYDSPEEQAEAEYMGGLTHEINERIGEKLAEDSHTATDALENAIEDGRLAIPKEALSETYDLGQDDKYLKPDDDDAAAQADDSEAFTEEMLEDMHLIPNEDDRESARAAWIAEQRKAKSTQTAANISQAHAAIDNATQLGNGLLDIDGDGKADDAPDFV